MLFKTNIIPCFKVLKLLVNIQTLLSSRSQTIPQYLRKRHGISSREEFPTVSPVLEAILPLQLRNCRQVLLLLLWVYQIPFIVVPIPVQELWNISKPDLSKWSYNATNGDLESIWEIVMESSAFRDVEATLTALHLQYNRIIWFNPGM